VEADLTVAVGGERLSVRGEGDRIVVECPSFAAARSARDALGALSTVGPAAAAAGLAVDVRVRGTSVARLAPDAAPGPLSRLAGVAPARLSLPGLLRALVRRVGR
jgi:hypothetical protein